MIVFLIDADNLCAPVWVEEAFRKLEEIEGSISVRRAYGSAEKLKGLTEVLRRRVIRPFVNLSLSKNTTDVALAVNAMELSYQTPQPTTVVIGSGDADFVPLVLRLRERGFRMVCVSEQRKMAPEASPAYDMVMLVGEVQPSSLEPELVAAEDVNVPTISTTRLRDRTEESKPPVKNVTAKKVAPSKVTAKKSASVLTREKTPTAEVLRILEVVPALKSGKPVAIREAAKLLHEEKLIGKSVPSTKLFKKYPTYFELTPTKLPNQVRFLRRLV